MRLTTDEMKSFEAACADQRNAHAQALVNALGSPVASSILAQIAALPHGIKADLATSVRDAIEEQRRRPARRTM